MFGSATPNFTATGDQITFGLTQIFGLGAASVFVADYDNLNCTVNAPLALLGVGVLGLGFAARKRS